MNQTSDKVRVVSVDQLQRAVKSITMRNDGRNFPVGWNAALNALLKYVELFVSEDYRICPHWIGGVCERDKEEEGRYV